MSGLRSRLKNILRPPGGSSWRRKDQATPPAASTSDAPSVPRPKSKKDDLGFLEIVSGTDPIVDIVAIHGLNGHRKKTWTTEDGILWLRDLLPSDLLNARVLTYGYDADTESEECVSTQTIRRHADGLANALVRIRKDAPRRPIIFIAHDLGGIILKSALTICHNQNLTSKGDLRNILVSTHAILFFGTPHSGVERATLEAIETPGSVFMPTTNIVLKVLEAHSSELENIQSSYVAASENINSIFFCEEYVTSGNQKMLKVQHHSAVIAGDRNATTIVLHADHQDLVRFPNKDNDNYQAVLHYLRDYIDSAPRAAGEKWATEDNCRNAANGQPASQEVGPPPKSRPSVSRSYIERARIEQLITQTLLPTTRGQRQPRCVLYGLGGAGKTQLATKWIRDHESRFARVIFVDASSQAQLETDLERSIRCLGSEYSKLTWADAVAYLDGKEKGWLLFVDNADSPDLDLRPYLPGSAHGAILITTRNRECADYASDGAVAVGGLEQNEAVNLLHTIAEFTPASEAKSLEIVKELGMLALAITQAGVYIRKTRRFDAYLDTFRKHRAQLMRTNPDRGTDYPYSTYTAFDLSFRQLPATTQELLKLFASLHHSLVPITLFEKSITSGFSADTIRASCPPPESDKTFISYLESILGSEWNEVAFQEIIDPALRASLIDISTDGLFYTVHPLLQIYMLDTEENRRYTRMTSQLVLGAIRPLEGSNAPYWQLLPHVNSIPRSVQSENIAHALAFCHLYKTLGDSRPRRELLECALSLLVATQGRQHEDSIWLMAELGTALSHCGQLEEAEKVERDVLGLRLEILGGRHPDTIYAMGNLANTLFDRGQLDEAEKMRREVLGLRLEILGGQHTDTIVAMNNLAITLYSRGQLGEAEKMEREVLQLRLKILGGRHPDTISAMNNLANILSDCGQLDEAEKMRQEVLGLQLEILGGRHPYTILAMSNLAITLFKRGQLEEAEKMEREVLQLRLEILGGRHPDTIMAMNNLAVTLSECGQLDEAEKMRREVLGLQLEILGGRHPVTISAMSNLACTLFDRGQLDEAEKMRQDVLRLRLEILGE